MNALLDLTVYDRRRSKVKSSTANTKQLPATKRTERSKAKSKSLIKLDTGSKSTLTVEKPKKAKRILDNSHYGSVTSLTSVNEIKSASKVSKDSDNSVKNKCVDIEPIQLRNKPAKSAEVKTVGNFIQDAINGFNYTGSIELKFEEALDVCSDNLYDEIDEEFGRNLFDDESDNYILEAYNRPGDELVETYMEVEHRTVALIHEDKSVQPPQSGKNDQSLHLISDDEECVFIEAYNSIGNELRKTYSLIDKKDGVIDADFQARTLSITSDVQEYFNDIGNKCESEDQPYPTANTYMNYSRAIDEYKAKQQAGDLKKISVIDGEIIPKRREVTQRDADLRQPTPEIYNKYDRAMEELRRSMPAVNLKCVKEAEEVESEGSSLSSGSSDERIYEVTIPEPANIIKFIPKTKSDFIIHELLETELVYINNLKKILSDYLSHFRKFPIQSQANINTIFGNIEEIYRQTIDFYQALLMCSNDYEAIALTFVDYKSLFNLYPIYMKNKPKADGILLTSYKPFIEDRQKKLKDRLDLMSYLLNPIQRLGRYILLLENLQKSVRKSQILDPAVEILKANMTKGNDAIAVESILKLPESLDLYKKGSYIDREKFTMIKPKRQEIVLFLFEEIVVFTTENASARRDVHTTFTYNNSIEMNDLSITIVDGELQTFQLADYPKCKKNKEEGTFVFEARDRKTRDNWGTLIQKKLWEQLERFKDQSKSYKPVSRTNSTASARYQQPYSSHNGPSVASSSASRESSTKSKKTAAENNDDKKVDKSNDKVKRRTKKQKSDVTKRNSRFYTDPQNYKTM